MKKYAQTLRHLQVKSKKKGRLNVQMDQLWAEVDNKGIKQWVWIAIDAETSEIIGLCVGDHRSKSASALWDSLAPVYRQCAVCYTDLWEAYQSVLPSKRHQAVDKKTGKTSLIERINCILRQRVSRLIILNHIGAIWYFVHNYNTCLSI